MNQKIILRNWLCMCALGFGLVTPVGAQINIETEGKSVSIGPNGIFVQKGDKTVNLRTGPAKVSVKRTVGTTAGKPKPRPLPSTQVQSTAQIPTTNIEPIVLNDNNIAATMPMAANKALVVNGNKCTITLTGNAAGVIVNGNSNHIVCGAVSTVQVNGNENVVTWKKGLTGPNPMVVNLGNENSLSRN